MNAPSHRVVSLRVFGCAGRLGAVASLALATSASPIPAPQSACTPVWQAIPGSPPNNLVNGFGSFDDGGGEALYAGGEFTSVGGVAANRVAKWNGTAWSTLGVGVDAVAWDFANYDDGGGEALYVGGNFTSAGGLAANRVAKWSGSTWSALGTGVNAMVFALGVYDDGAGDALYAGGQLTSAGGTSANYIAKWNGSSWSALGSGTDGYVHALAVFDDGGGPALYVGGGFNTAGGVTAKCVAKWNGSSWSALAPHGALGVVYALEVFDDGGGPALYAAGTISGSGVLKWNGSSWSDLGSGVLGNVFALRTFDDGNGSALYAGGFFSTAGGVAVSRIAKWSGSAWSALGTGTIGGAVYALRGFDHGFGPALYVGGTFTSSPAGNSHVAKWGCPLNSSGTPYCTSGTTTNGCVPAISGSGAASASASSGFNLSVANVEGQKSGLLFYGITGAHSATWSPASTSYLCVKAPTQRMGTQNSGGSSGACDGVLAEDWNAYRASHPSALGAPFAAGATVWSQAWFRDPAAPKTTNLSNGLVFQVGP